jgi:DNA-binding MarR family transcriptional regulator
VPDHPPRTRPARDDLIAELRRLGEIDSTQTTLFHQAAAARNGLSVTDMKALGVLLREGPQTAGSLMTALGVTSGAVTGVIERLQRAGVAVREVDPIDRRRAVVRLDEQGFAARENLYLSIGAAFERLYAGYTEEELAFLVRHLRASVDITRAETAALSALETTASPPA